MSRTTFANNVVGRNTAAEDGGESHVDLAWYQFYLAEYDGRFAVALDFPLAEHFGQQSLSGIGGTRNCDWWFTDEAVFLDTAGRYLTQDSDATADSAAWQPLAEMPAVQ